MEPNINIDSSIQVLYGDYKKILSNKIIDVCNKIRETYSEIKWIIYDPYKKVNSYIERIQNALIGTAGRDYGYCDIQNSIIYIL